MFLCKVAQTATRKRRRSSKHHMPEKGYKSEGPRELCQSGSHLAALTKEQRHLRHVWKLLF